MTAYEIAFKNYETFIKLEKKDLDRVFNLFINNGKFKKVFRPKESVNNAIQRVLGVACFLETFDGYNWAEIDAKFSEFTEYANAYLTNN